MPKRKEPELTPDEQFKRFVKTAREHEVDESGKTLEEVLKKISRSHEGHSDPKDSQPTERKTDDS